MNNFTPRTFLVQAFAVIAMTQALYACAAIQIEPADNKVGGTTDTGTSYTEAHQNALADSQASDTKTNFAKSHRNASTVTHPSPTVNIKAVIPLTVDSAGVTGKLRDRQLTEVSGLSASMTHPGILYAINDSGNTPALYAIDKTGQLLEQWRINARNRDWEDMTHLRLAGRNYLVIGDTGDNLRVHRTASLLFFAEPEIPASKDTLDPAFTLHFHYEDGPRNVEAIAALGPSLYLLSKEPVGISGSSPSGIYQLALPASLDEVLPDKPLTATRIGSMPLRSGGLESRLAAALAGVDLSHPTALAFDVTGNTAYILTYREVLRVRRDAGQSWANALSQPAERILSHNLPQAEALTVSEEHTIWFTSENAGAPLWAIPIEPPL